MHNEGPHNGQQILSLSKVLPDISKSESFSDKELKRSDLPDLYTPVWRPFKTAFRQLYFIQMFDIFLKLEKYYRPLLVAIL